MDAAPNLATPGRCNVGSFLDQAASIAPERAAVIESAVSPLRMCSFEEIASLAIRFGSGAKSLGVGPGDLTLVMVRPGIEFAAVMFGLFRIGAIPVLIDPGMGLRRLMQCMKGIGPTAMVGIPLAHLAARIFWRAFSTVRTRIVVGRRAGGWSTSFEEVVRRGATGGDVAATSREDLAAVLFTSGSTGPAKGVRYLHGTFEAQIRAIQTTFGMTPGEVDLPGFAPFGLYSLAMGMTIVVPDMNPSRPAKVDPARIVRAIHGHRVSTTFGSPAMWERISRFCLRKTIRLPSLRRVLLAGAPIDFRLVDRVRRIMAYGGEVYTPYGATEGLPIACAAGGAILSSFAQGYQGGGGVCVGSPVDGAQVRVIRAIEEGISHWGGGLAAAQGEVGEIVVSGPMVAPGYHNRPDADRLSKIQDGATVWHRMGDVGCLDSQGRLWCCGRKSHRVETRHGPMDSIPCEAIFNAHPAVRRSALVGIGDAWNQTPVIVIDTWGRIRVLPWRNNLRAELLQLAQQNSKTANIRTLLFRGRFPVDPRHNIKIDREALSHWAERKLR